MNYGYKKRVINHILNGRLDYTYVTILTPSQIERLFEEHKPKDYLRLETKRVEGHTEYKIVC